jgi:Ca2+-binding EF-hand superfamily protein
MFKELDQDQDGAISWEEFVSGIGKLGILAGN